MNHLDSRIAGLRARLEPGAPPFTASADNSPLSTVSRSRLSLSKLQFKPEMTLPTQPSSPFLMQTTKSESNIFRSASGSYLPRLVPSSPVPQVYQLPQTPQPAPKVNLKTAIKIGQLKMLEQVKSRISLVIQRKDKQIAEQQQEITYLRAQVNHLTIELEQARSSQAKTPQYPLIEEDIKLIVQQTLDAIDNSYVRTSSEPGVFNKSTNSRDYPHSETTPKRSSALVSSPAFESLQNQIKSGENCLSRTQPSSCRYQIEKIQEAYGLRPNNKLQTLSEESSHAKQTMGSPDAGDRLANSPGKESGQLSSPSPFQPQRIPPPFEVDGSKTFSPIEPVSRPGRTPAVGFSSEMLSGGLKKSNKPIVQFKDPSSASSAEAEDDIDDGRSYRISSQEDEEAESSPPAVGAQASSKQEVLEPEDELSKPGPCLLSKKTCMTIKEESSDEEEMTPAPQSRSSPDTVDLRVRILQNAKQGTEESKEERKKSSFAPKPGQPSLGLLSSEQPRRQSMQLEMKPHFNVESTPEVNSSRAKDEIVQNPAKKFVPREPLALQRQRTKHRIKLGEVQKAKLRKMNREKINQRMMQTSQHLKAQTMLDAVKDFIRAKYKVEFEKAKKQKVQALTRKMSIASVPRFNPLNKASWGEN